MVRCFSSWVTASTHQPQSSLATTMRFSHDTRPFLSVYWNSAHCPTAQGMGSASTSDAGMACFSAGRDWACSMNAPYSGGGLAGGGAEGEDEREHPGHGASWLGHSMREKPATRGAALAKWIPESASPGSRWGGPRTRAAPRRARRHRGVCCQGREQAAHVGGRRQVAALVEVPVAETGPVGVHPATHGPPEHEGGPASAVIRATRAVGGHCATETPRPRRSRCRTTPGPRRRRAAPARRPACRGGCRGWGPGGCGCPSPRPR